MDGGKIVGDVLAWILTFVIAPWIGGSIVFAVVRRKKLKAATQGTFHCGLRVLEGHQPGLSREWLIGEWAISPEGMRLGEESVSSPELVADSKREGKLSELVGASPTTIVQLRTATALLEWSMTRRLEDLALRALDGPDLDAALLPEAKS